MKNEVFYALHLPDAVLIQLLSCFQFWLLQKIGLLMVLSWLSVYKKFCYGHFHLLLCLSGMWFIVAISFHKKVIINPKQRGL